MKDVNVEIGQYNFSSVAVTKRSKEAFIEGNSGRFGELDLSDVYDSCAKALADANKPLKTAVDVPVPVSTEPIADNTEGDERGVQGTSASKKPVRKSKK